MATQRILEPGSQESLKEKVQNGPKLIMGNEEFLFEPFSTLDDSYIERAKNDIRENPENTTEAFQILRELLKGEPNLDVPESNDFLIKFLRPCKWYPQSAFELIKRFYKFCSNYSQYYTDLIPSNEKVVFSTGILTPLPLRCEDGARILLLQSGNCWNPKKITLAQIFRGVILILEAAITEPKTQISGVHVILDMEGLSLSHVTQFTPGFARAVLEWVQRCLPCRIRGIHVVNQSYLFNMVFAIFKPFIQEKLRKKIHFHGTNRESLFKLVDSKALPKKYGGELDFEHKSFSEAFWKYFCLFDEDVAATLKYGYISKR